MNNFEKIKNMSFEDFCKWLDEHRMIDAPWMDWWSKNYCDKCESIIVKAKDAEALLGITPFFNKEQYECTYCEINDGKCRFFPNQEAPNMKTIMRMWLEAKVDG